MPDTRIVAAPVEFIPTDLPDRVPDDGMALCLSGGGYRAMLFHLGSLWRLYDSGVLRDVDRISSVSGGSITAGALALNWKNLSFAPGKMGDDFVPLVVNPIRRLAGKTIDRGAILSGIFLPGTISDRVIDAYRDLFGDSTLQSLPSHGEGPRFVFNATNVQTGALWRFSKPYMGDWKVGRVENPSIEMAVAVAASSAFPPFLSPVTLDVEPEDFTLPGDDNLKHEVADELFRSQVILTDGGVYDNLGLETAWKRFKTVLVSDAGGKMAVEADPEHDWGRHAHRVLSIIDNQVRSLRKRQLIGSYVTDERAGAYWGIRSDIAKYDVRGALPCPAEQTLKLADTPTRLKRLNKKLQMRLINWGYGVTDAAIRKHLDTSLQAPANFPYPEAPV